MINKKPDFLLKNPLSFLEDWEVVPVEEKKKAYKGNRQEKLIARLRDGLIKQIEYARLDLAGKKPDDFIKRWYQKNGKEYDVFLKYQNKPIPYLNGNSLAVKAVDLNKVIDFYKIIIKQLDDGAFQKHIFECVQNMDNIASINGSGKLVDK